MITQLSTETGIRDIYTGYDVIVTPSASVITLCQALIYVGDVANPAYADGGLLTLTVSIAGQAIIPSFQATVDDDRVAVWSSQFPVPANAQVIIHIASDDPNDTAVRVVATIYNVAATDTAITTAISDLQTHIDVNLDAKVSTRSTLAAGAVMNLDPAYDAAKTAASATALAAVQTHGDSSWATADVSSLALEATSQDILDAISALGPGTGIIAFPFTLEDTSHNPIDGVRCEVWSLAPGETLVATGYTNSNGLVTFNLDAGSYVVRSQRAGYNIPDQPITVA